jgi:hypothetical protein
MALSIGIVGLPNVGKSTLFNALTGAGALAANYPFATIDPNTGIVPIPDPRVERLAAVLGSKRAIPATVTFVDIAGLVEGASRGEGLGNRFLHEIREVGAVCHVVRAFESESVAHVGGGPDPKRDIEIVETELALADLETIERRLPRLEKEATADKSLAPRVRLLEELRDVVASGDMVGRQPGFMGRVGEFSELHLLTAKPVIYVFNMDMRTIGDDQKKADLTALVSPAPALFIDAQIEAELIGLDEAERAELLEEIGQAEPGLNAMIGAAHRALGLQTFLTGSEKEARAWTIGTGATALDAAGVIHTDFQRGFIAAEVVDFDRLVELGSWHQARSSGLVRTEGRTYVMKANDVVEFRFNV